MVTINFEHLIMPFLSTPITFDRFVRGLLFLAGAAVLIAALRWLSPVLIPFLAAWALAWILIPVVHFFQYTCRLRSRALSVGITLSLAVAVMVLLAWWAMPMVIDGLTHIKDATLRYLQSDAKTLQLPEWLQHYVEKGVAALRLEEMLREGKLISALRNALPHVWGVFLSTVDVVMGLTSVFFSVLYLLFLLIDYERFSTGWLAYMPQRSRRFLSELAHDIAHHMRGYFRGQALIALWNCMMFSLGFWIIGLPMPIGMGCFVGLISFVPYVQVVGFLPAALLALLQMAETGRSFWMLMLLVLVVYVVVQIIQDVFITPRIMGGIMGLRPAIILLSLSVWGFIGGILGLVVGLPLTTILIDYYRRYLVPPTAEETVPQEGKAE